MKMAPNKFLSDNVFVEAKKLLADLIKSQESRLTKKCIDYDASKVIRHVSRDDTKFVTSLVCSNLSQTFICDKKINQNTCILFR